MAATMWFRCLPLALIFVWYPASTSGQQSATNLADGGMTFIINFDISAIICQTSDKSENLTLFPISELCNGDRKCVDSPNMNDESVPFCSKQCEKGCGEHGVCLVDGGQSQCYCDNGYGGKSCEAEDANECSKKPCHWLAKCTNTFGSYYCSCLPGFSGDGLNCTDIDECNSDDVRMKCPANSNCVNVPGSFFCNCSEGYQSKGVPLKECIDIDECKEGKATCAPGTTCVNAEGSYKCLPDDRVGLDVGQGKKCDEGFEWKEDKCVDIDECQRPDVCASRASCQNIDGSYRCVCPAGFTGDGKTCSPLTDCSANADICDKNAFCVSDLRMCLCHAGYIGDGVSCYDIDECLAGKACETGEKCVNTNGSFACCSSSTSDADCIAAKSASCNGGCGPNADCVGGHCTCRPGYGVNPLVGCTDINECEQRPDICRPEQWCVNLEGGHICCDNGASVSQCQGLMIGVPSKKTDDKENPPFFDEQSPSSTVEGTTTTTPKPNNTEGVADCSPIQRRYCSRKNRTCSMASGFPDCVDCLPEFVAVDNDCIAAGESNSGGDCLDSAKNDCHQNAVCLDIRPSGHSCACKTGFIGDGKRCDDVDECYTPNICSPHAKCVNTVGSYRCVCKDGYTGDGRFCTSVCPNGDLPDLISGPCSSTADTCAAGHTCQNGHCCPLSDVPVKCDRDLDICGGNATCLEGRCACLPGYRRLNGECQDVDECLDSEIQSICKKDQKCLNFPGNFACCPPENAEDAKLCPNVTCGVDKQTCASDASCVNGQCLCDIGYEGNGTSCRPSKVSDVVGDCSSAPHLCHPNAACRLSACKCNEGYLGDGYLSCLPDPDDCFLNVRLCDAATSRCVDRRCQCLQGFVGNGSDCRSVAGANCEQQPSICHWNADCLAGNCTCREGYIGNGFSCIPDPNDCETYLDLCHKNAVCEARRCRCNDGFQGDGKACASIDLQDCTLDATVCNKNAECLETAPGSGQKRCKCSLGYIGNGVNCDELSTVGAPSSPGTVPPEIPEQKNITSDGTASGSVTFVTEPYVERKCRAADASECHALASCITIVDGFKCVCQPGYEGDGKTGCQRISNARVDVECQDDGIVMLFNETDFNGRIFIKSQSQNPYCSKDFLKTDGPLYKFKAPFSYCDIKSEPHNTFSAVVVIQKHPLFVTASDEAYNLRCSYPTDELNVMGHFNVSTLNTEEAYINNGTMPTCNLAVLEGDKQVSEVFEAVVGQKLQLRLNVEPKNIYGILARNCLAVNMNNGETYSLTDSAGCAVDLSLFPEWTQNSDDELSANFVTFKWPDTSQIRFQCDCSPCFQKCEPAKCSKGDGWGRKKRSTEQLSSTGVFSSILMVHDNELAIDESEDIDRFDDAESAASELNLFSEEHGIRHDDICIHGVAFAWTLALAVASAVGILVAGATRYCRVSSSKASAKNRELDAYFAEQRRRKHSPFWDRNSKRFH